MNQGHRKATEVGEIQVLKTQSDVHCSIQGTVWLPPGLLAVQGAQKPGASRAPGVEAAP